MNQFPEQKNLENLIELSKPYAEVRTLGTVTCEGRDFPVTAFVLGSKDKSKPTFGLFGGVHGLERVGSQAVIAWLESLFESMKWDRDLDARLRDVRIVTIPIVNPGGMYLGRRSNPNGVDLMRNSPVEAVKKPPWLLGGHRVSARLPWFRGEEGKPMELEAKWLTDFVREEMFSADFSMALDVHSGFGVKDQLWYPYARSSEPFPHVEAIEKFRDLLNRNHPNHVYVVEPQSLNYTTHGDLWDHIYDEYLKVNAGRNSVFLPWTLEMGSWIWVRKNPIQFFSAMGIFNPVKAHRLRRTLRRHMPLFDFYVRATKNFGNWV